MVAQLTPEDLKTVEAKIAEIEKHTSGEIVVHVVARSDDYGGARLAWSVVVAALVAELAAFQLAMLDAWALEIAAALTVLFWFLLGVPVLLRGLVPNQSKHNRVHRRALAAFIENGVHRTRDASGVLILLSMFERRVEILADAGIHARVGTDGWRSHVGRIVAGMKSGKPVDGLCETIGLIGEELKAGMPIREDDENELSNEVVVTRH